MLSDPISGIAATYSLDLLRQAVADAIDMLPQATVSWWRTTARVWAPDRHQDLLRSILPPAEPAGAQGAALLRDVIVIEDDTLARRLVELADHPVSVDGLRCATGAIDGRPLAWMAADAWPDHLVVVRLRDDTWVAVVSPGPRAARASEVVIKQVLETDLTHRGAVPLHASAAVLPDQDEAIVFLGHAGAGKTTSAVTVARAGGRLIAGDRLSVLRSAPGDSAFVVGSAQSTRLRWGTIRGLGLEQAISGLRLERHGLDHPVLRPGSPEKVVLGHGELASLGLRTGSSARLGPVVMLERRADDEAPSLTACADGRAELVGPHLRRSWLAVPSVHEAAPDLSAVLDTTPWFRLRWQPEHDNLPALLAGVSS